MMFWEMSSHNFATATDVLVARATQYVGRSIEVCYVTGGSQTPHQGAKGCRGGHTTDANTGSQIRGKKTAKLAKSYTWPPIREIGTISPLTPPKQCWVGDRNFVGCPTYFWPGLQVFFYRPSETSTAKTSNGSRRSRQAFGRETRDYLERKMRSASPPPSPNPTGTLLFHLKRRLTTIIWKCEKMLYQLTLEGFFPEPNWHLWQPAAHLFRNVRNSTLSTNNSERAM